MSSPRAAASNTTVRLSTMYGRAGAFEIVPVKIASSSGVCAVAPAPVVTTLPAVAGTPPVLVPPNRYFTASGVVEPGRTEANPTGIHFDSAVDLRPNTGNSWFHGDVGDVGVLTLLGVAPIGGGFNSWNKFSFAVVGSTMSA